MQTRRDLYQAYKLMTQRLGMALLQGEPDLPESPMRRQNVAMFGGVLVAVLVAAVFGVLGLLRPGNATALTDPGTVIVEEETGATFVYSDPQKKMIPVANVTSARLLLGEQEVKVRTVTAASIAKYTRGALVGIQGAPESLPAHDRLVRTPWSVCVTEGVDTNGERRPYTSLIGGFGVGGNPIEQGTAMVVAEGGQAWLLWADRRMRVPAKGVRALTQGQPRQVPAAWLNGVPIGPDFQSPSIPGLGGRTRGPDGKWSAVGRVFTVPAVTGGPAKWYVLLADGLADLTPTQATLLLADPVIKKAYGQAEPLPKPLAPATANGMRQSGTRLDGSGLPTTMPKIIPPSPTSPLCAVYSDTERGSTRAALTVGSTAPLPQPPKGWFNQSTVDQVTLSPGSGALVGTLPGNGRTDSVTSLYLIGDQGRRHAILSANVLPSLGYSSEDIAPLPAQLVHLIPEGPALDPAAARNPVQANPSATAPQQR
ncbi:type VII secretion protein EccB [Streptosporangium album]|uniref:Type VII secretion protein EccB n=1 Tax=Streptosporangium album TaxID=47479 RepID=A0A7W7RS18_9ACTN|nr:type VII secretion protein EccB [Streptosporangium album]MBB4937131.1 type VII secretion protein EccB [Streptosporangium album]